MTSIAYAALWLFVFSVPWERILVLPGVSIIPRVTGAVALVLALLAVVMTGRFRRWHSFHVVALLFWLWAGVVQMYIGGGPRLPNKFWTFAQLLLVVWMMWELATTERRIRGLFFAYVLGAYVAAFDTILLSRRAAGVLRRFAAGGADPNDLAMILSLGLPMAWYLGVTAPAPLQRWLCRAYVPVAIVAVGLTGSRGGMVAATVGLLFLPLSMTRLSPGRLTAAITMLGLAGVLAVAYTPETLMQRLASTGTELEGGSVGGRGKLWKAGWEAFRERPIMGYGPSQFKFAITPMLGPLAQVAHNSYLSVAVEQGIIGFLLFMGMLIAVFLSLLRLPRLDRRFALVLMLTVCATMLPLTWEDRRAVWVVLSLLVGLAQAMAPATVAAPTIVGRASPMAAPRPPRAVRVRTGRPVENPRGGQP